MDEKTIKNNDEIEIDLKRLFDALLGKLWLIILTSILGAVAAFLFTFFMIEPEYQSSAMFYVNNSSISVGEASVSISSADISASRGLVDTYIVILNTRETLNDVIDYAGVDMNYRSLKGKVSAADVSNTEIFRVTVTDTDPERAEKLANAIAYILPKRISSIIEGTSAKIVDSAVVPVSPSSPNYTNNTMIGFLVGLVISVALIVIFELLDISIRVEEDITRVAHVPVLASVPDMSATGKGGYYSGYGYGYGYGAYGKKKKQSSAPGQQKQPDLIGNDISFAASEAYKLLRTKLQFSFADEQESHIIGVSSALTGEGKSLTAVNLAHALSQLDQNVLLIDCDMRRPSLAAKLPIAKKPGLSGYLSGQNKLDQLLQNCGIKGDEAAFHVIAAGQNPPNPIELLSSARMAKLLNMLRESYDYIILDLPPVGEVSDALAVAKEMDGLLLVVRQHYCDRIALSAAVRQFEFVESRLLGVVYNCTREDSNGYGYGYYRRYYRRYYKRYYSKYARKYEGAYVSATRKNANSAPKGER